MAPWPNPPDPAVVVPRWTFKEGVPDVPLAPHLADGLRVLARCWAEFWSEGMTITSTSDGKHMEGSLHYAQPCAANDIRLPGPLRDFLAEARGRLGAGFDLVLEKDHLHMEYDPK